MDLAEKAEQKIEEFLGKATEYVGRTGDRFDQYISLAEAWTKVLKATKAPDESWTQAVEAIKRTYE